jgi:hypothetical protein
LATYGSTAGAGAGGLTADTLARQPNGLLGAAAAELVKMIKPSPTA